jgi:hypothetical protein
MSSNDVESIQIHLNSKFADNYVNGSYSNCEFFLPVIEIPPQHHIYISCILANIPYSFYNIDTNNNKFNFVVNNVSNFTMLIPPGNYNVYQLMNYIQSNNTQLSLSYDVITNKITFTHPSYDFYFLQSSTCLELFGFKSIDSQLSMTSSFGKLTSNYCINLQSKHCICVQVNYQTGNINISNKLSNNILASIPVNGQPYSMIIYRNSNSGFRSNLYTNTLGYLNVKLIDQNNNIMNLNGCHWTLTLQLDIVKFVD